MMNIVSMDKTKIIKQFNRETSIGLRMAKHCLEYANYDVTLARKIAEHYGLAVRKNYTVGKIIKDYYLTFQ